jgi:soluble lytic murein transglycosylase-like protein
LPRKFRQNGGGQFGAQLGAQDGKTLSKSLGGATGGQLGGDAGALVSDLQTQAQDKGQPGLGGPATGLQDAQNTQQAETQLQNDDAKARETRGEGVAQANQDAAADVKNFVAQQTQTGQGSSGGSGPSSAPSTQPATVGASGASASAAASGSGALGPNVPKALQPFVQDINAAAKQTGVPASLIGAQILQESGGDPHAVTTNPALGLPDTGLMQVDQATFQGLQKQYPSLLGGKSVSDPATNIMAGALLDAQLLKQNNGNTSAALTAYNGNATSGYANDVTAKLTALQNGTPVPGGFS